MNRTVRAVALLAIALGCTDATTEPPDTTASPADASAPPCTACPDVSPSEDDSTTPVVGDLYEVGTNLAGKASADAFTPASAGVPLNVVLGPQSAWMVVVAARTDMFDCCVDRVDVITELRATDGTLFGQLKYKRRPLLDGGDGYRYLMNVFLVVGSPTEWDGREADLTVAITPHEGGDTLTETVRVTLQMDGG